MEDIKVGEYVRSLVNGNISKVLEISDLLEEPNIKYYKTGTFTGFCSTENYNVKHSPNIIDLIEVGDIIEYKSYSSDDILKEEVWKTKGNNIVYTIDGTEVNINSIKSIVTKEQFDSIKYEVKI